MAITTTDSANNVPQAPVSGGYFPRAYHSYCAKLAAISRMPAGAKDEEFAEAQSAADDLLISIQSARATSLPDLLLKVRAVQHNAKDAAHATDDPGVFNVLSWIADDLEFIVAAESDAKADPAIAAYHAFTAAHDALDSGPDDDQGALTEAASRAYRALLAVVPTTAAGAALQFKGHLRWAGTPGDEDHEALCRICDALERLTAGKAARS
jgi:hypothetical protein